MSRIGFWGVIGGGISVMFALIVILMISGILPYLFNWQQIQDMNVDSALVVIAEADGKLPGDLITHNLYPDGNNTRDVGRSTGWYNEGYFYDGNFNRISVTTHADIGNLTVGNNTTIAGDLTINVSNPVKVGGAACAATARGIYVAGNYAYVVSDSTGDDIEVFDISDPTAPTKVGGAACASNANGIYVAGNYAYVVSDSTGDDIEIFDISDPTAPTKVGGANCDDSALGVYVSGNYAYVLSYVAGDDIEVFDISDPTAPTKVGGANCDDSALGVYVSGNYAYVASSSTGDDLEIFDIGGFNAATAQIGALKAGSLQVTDNAQVGNDLYVRHGIITGSGGIYAQGDSAFDGDVWIGGNSTDALYVVGNVSADGFNEFCVVYQGNAIEALKGIEATSEDTWAEVDHSTLPEGVRVTWQETRWVRIADGEVMPKNFDAGNQTGNILYKNQSITIEGRSLSRTVQVNTKALLELIARVEELEARR